jgi:hypothetical protein
VTDPATYQIVQLGEHEWRNDAWRCRDGECRDGGPCSASLASSAA